MYLNACSHVCLSLSICVCDLFFVCGRLWLLQNTDGNKCDELYQRISFLERELEGVQKEAYELREQNELLEFRNIELEESFEKVCMPYAHTHNTILVHTKKTCTLWYAGCVCTIQTCSRISQLQFT